MAWLSGYRFRKKIGITGQAGAGTDYQVPLTVHSGKWTSPTSFDDPDSAWNTETLIYDGNTTTSGYTFTHDHYLELILDSAIDTDTVRIYGQIVDLTPPGAYYDIEVDIDLFYGADWHNIFSGTIAKNTWVEKTNPAGIKSVTKARIKSNNASYTTRIYEFEFEARAGAGKVWLWDYCTDFPNDIRFTDDDGETELDHWCEDLTADPAKFWIEVADDLDSNQDIYIYFGKSRASTASNGVNTFLLFDDFDDETFDAAKWARSDVSVVESGGYIELQTGANRWLKSQDDMLASIAVEGKAYSHDTTYHASAQIEAGCTGNPAHVSYSNLYCMPIHASNGRERLYDNGVLRTERTGLGLHNEEWLSFSLKVNGTTIKGWYISESNEISGTLGSSNPSDPFGFFCYGSLGGIYTRYDDIRVRKYIDPEPSVGTPGNQEVNPVIIMHHRKMLEEE